MAVTTLVHAPTRMGQENSMWLLSNSEEWWQVLSPKLSENRTAAVTGSKAPLLITQCLPYVSCYHAKLPNNTMSLPLQNPLFNQRFYTFAAQSCTLDFSARPRHCVHWQVWCLSHQPLRKGQVVQPFPSTAPPSLPFFKTRLIPWWAGTCALSKVCMHLYCSISKEKISL